MSPISVIMHAPGCLEFTTSESRKSQQPPTSLHEITVTMQQLPGNSTNHLKASMKFGIPQSTWFCTVCFWTLPTL